LSLGRYCKAFYEASVSLTSSLKLQDVLGDLVRNAAEGMGVKAASIRLLDESGKRLELAAAYGLSQEYLSKGPVELEKSLIDREALQGNHVIVPDVAKDDRIQYKAEAEREGLRSILCVPLRTWEKALGTLRVYTSDKHEFAQEEILFLMALARIGAAAIENSRLYEDLGRNHASLNKLLEISKAMNSSLEPREVFNVIARNVAEAMGVKAASIRLLDESGKRLELAAAYGLSQEYLSKGPVELEKSLIDREVIRKAESISVDVLRDKRWQYPEEAKREGIAYVVCVPLMRMGTVIGTLRVYSEKVVQFDRGNIEFLLALANMAATAIYNAKLYKLVRTNWERLTREVWELLGRDVV
jgi:signal transduction protein with GAF and PtsI domain